MSTQPIGNLLDRTIAPSFKKIDPVQFSWPVQDRINDTIPLFVLNAGSQPVVKLELIFKSGQWYEPKNGVAYFAAQMLKEGTRKKNTQAIAQYIDQYGASLDMVVNSDYCSIQLMTLSRYLEPMLSLVAELLFAPTFPKASLDRLKNIKTQSLKVKNEKNDHIAKKKLRVALFGKQHPYGKCLTEKAIAAIDLESLQHYYQHHLLAECAVFFSGKIDDIMIQIVKKHLQGLRCHKNNLRAHVSTITAPATLHIAKPASQQTTMSLGKVWIKKTHPDYLPMLFVNTLLGGYFGSRLMQNIREKKGYTYGIFSKVNAFKHASYFFILTNIIKGSGKKTRQAIDEEIYTLQKQAVPVEELENLKNYMLGRFLSAINDPFSLMEKFKQAHFHELDQGYYQQFFDTVLHINASEIKALAQKYLTPDSLTEVVVG